MMIRENDFSMMKKLLELSLEQGDITIDEYNNRLQKMIEILEVNNLVMQSKLDNSVNKYLQELSKLHKNKKKDKDQSKYQLA